MIYTNYGGQQKYHSLSNDDIDGDDEDENETIHQLHFQEAKPTSFPKHINNHQHRFSQCS